MENSELTEITKIFYPRKKALKCFLQSLLIFCFACKSLTAAVEISEENLLILDLLIDDTKIAGNLIGYSNGESAFVSLYDFSDALEFAIDIKITRSNAQASGWFIDENRTFSLDTNNQSVAISGQKKTYSPDWIVVQENDLLVDLRLLSEWFPVDFSLKFSTLSVLGTAREELPFQKRAARNRQTISTLAQEPEPVLPLKESPYQFLSAPNVKFTLNYSSYREDEEDDLDTTLNYSLSSSGEFAYMSAALFLNGTKDDEIANARLSLWRSDPDGNLFGPLGLTQFVIGDVSPPYMPYVSRPTERGITFTNQDLFRSSIFDTIDLKGDLLNDWEVEVYRNDILIGSQRDSTEGQYLFKDVPLTFGKNAILLVFYGPNGQERREIKNYNVGASMIQPGVFSHSTSISEQGKTLIDVNNQQDESSDSNARIATRLTYGINRNFSLVGGVHTSTVDDEQIDFGTLGITFSFSKLLGSYISARDSEGENGYSISASFPMGNFAWRASHAENTGLLVIGEEDKDRVVTEKTQLSLFGTIGQTSTATNLTTQKSKEEEEIIVSQSLSGRIQNLTINANARYASIEESDGDKRDDTLGRLLIGSRWGPIRYRGGIGYNFSPLKEITNGFLSATVKLKKRVSANFRLDHYPSQNAGDGLTKYVSGFNWRFDSLILSPTLTYDSEDRYRGFIFLTTDLSENADGDLAFNQRSRGQSGTVRVYVFWDKNSNGRWDNEDEAISGAKVRVIQGNHRAKTNDNGVAFLEYMAAHKQTDIQLVDNTWDDISLAPASAGYSVSPHPGVVTDLYLPLVKTGEIGGTLFLNEDGKVRELNNVKLNLVSNRTGKVVATEKSSYDGYYLFQQVPTGDYSVQISDKPALKLLRPISNIKISSRGDIHDGTDIVSYSTQPRRAASSMASVASSNNRQGQIKTLRISNQGSTGPIKTEPAKTRQSKTVVNKPAPRKKTGKGGYKIQLAAFRTQKSAQLFIDTAESMGIIAMLEEHRLSITKVNLGGTKGAYHRVMSADTVTKKDANQLCQLLKDIGQNCVVTASSY